MIQMLLGATPGTVGTIVNTKSARAAIFDVNFFVTGEQDDDVVEIWASGSSMRDDFIQIATITVGAHVAAPDTVETEGPWERLKAIAPESNSGNVDCFLQTSV